MKRLWMIVCLCLLITGIVAAQDDLTSTPLIAVFNGQIYRLEGDALAAYAACMPDEQLSVQFVSSPDGTKFAFATLPKIITAAITELGGLGDMPIGLNLWYCDTETDTLTRFHALEGGDEAFTGDLPQPAAINSTPAWSPDGQQLAWTAVTPDGTAYSLWIYDLATGEETQFPLDLPPPFMFPLPPTLYWGATALYMTLPAFNEETFVIEETLYTYDFETGAFSSQVILLSEGESSDFITDRLLLNDGTTEQFAIHLFEGGWIVVDPITGEQQPMDGVPLAYGENGLTGVNALADVDENFNFDWQVVGTEPPFVLESYPRQRIAFAPDGLQMAYADSTLHIWYDGAVFDVDNSDGFADDVSAQVIWGATHWMAAGGAAVAPAPLPTCTGTQQSRLRVGDTGQVISDTVPNRLRSNPSLSAEQVGVLPAAGAFTVLEGPVCADGYAWYRVQYEDRQGWTAEGSATEYFIQPAGE
jgi:hypothetical protein